MCLVAQSSPTLHDPVDCSLPGHLDVLLIPAKASPIFFFFMSHLYHHYCHWYGRLVVDHFSSASHCSESFTFLSLIHFLHEMTTILMLSL